MPPSNNTDPLFQSSKVFLNKQAHPVAPAQMPQGVEPTPRQGGGSYADVANGGGSNNTWSQYANVADVKGPASMKAQSITSLTDAQLMEGINAPLSGEEVAMKMAELQAQGIAISPENISKEEFAAYDPWREKQHFNFWGAVGEGALMAGADLGKGVVSGVTDWKKMGLAVGLSAIATPAVGFGVAFGSTAVEGFARGTRDLGGLAVMAANHPGSPIYRMFVNPTNDMDKKYEDFLDLAKWNHRSEEILAGKANVFMPERETYEKLFGKTFGNQVEDFIGVNKELATAASYFLDPTLYLSMGGTAAARGIAGKAGAAAIKSGQAGNTLGHAVTARAARNAFKASWMNSLGENLVKFSDATTKPIDAMFESITDNASKVLGTKVHITPNGQGRAARVAAGHGGTKGPTSLVHSAMGAVGMYSIFNIPYALPITSVYAGLKGVGLVGEAIIDVGMKGIQNSDTAIAKAMKMSSPLAIYMKDLGETTIKGGFYGGVIGGVAGGEEGAAGGIGTGMALGALGHNIGYAYGTLSGNFAKEALYKEFDAHVGQLREKGHLLKHDRVQEFVTRIAKDHGSEEATRAIAHIMTLEKSKNVSVSYMGYKDFAAALANDSKMWRTITDAQGKETKVLTELGETMKGALDRYGSFEADVEKIRPSPDFVGPMPSEKIAMPSQSWNGIFMGNGPDGKPNQKPVAIWQDGESRRWHIIINTDNVAAARDRFGNIIFDKYKEEGPRPTQKFRNPETVRVEGPRVDVTETLPAGIDQYGIPLKSKKERTVVKISKKDFVGPMPEVNETRWSEVEMQGPMPDVEKQRPRLVQASTAPLGELWHAMNAAYRRVNHGADVVNSVKDWLIGSGGKAGTAFKDRAGTVKFMHEVYRKLNGGQRDAAYDGNWRKAIEEFERTGKIETPEVADAFHDFIEELGEAMFLGYESGKPFDWVLKGGDLGFARNMVESVKDVWHNRVLREATNLGADVRTSKAFLDWFKKTRDDKNFKFDPIIENAFKDLVKSYTAHEMKDAGLGRTDLHKFTAGQLKTHAETYGYEDRLKYDKDGVPSLKSNEQYNAEQHNKSKALGAELGPAFLKNPALFNGVDLQVVTDGKSDIGTIESNFSSLDAASRDPNGSTSDTLGSRDGAMLYQSTDFGDVGPSLDDLHAAQKSGADASGVYPPRTSSSYGARGRPRTALTGKMAIDLAEAMKTGKKIIMRGIPSEALFNIIEKYIPKTVADNVRMLAPLIVDGGISKANVVSGSYHGFDQVDKNGVKQSRKSGDSFNARQVNFVPYDLELSWTLDNIKNPTVNYENPHFAYNAKVMDVDALNRRNHILWNENAELRSLYGDVHQFEEDVFRTIDEYSAYKEIPATEFFGDNADARLKRKYVTAALGASPNIAHKSAFSVAEAEWHSYQHFDRKATQNNPWHRLRLDGLTGAKSVDGERMRMRVNETMYYRSMKPTPTTDTGPMWKDSTGKPAMYQEGDIVNGVKMTPQPLGRRYDMNSEKWKSGFIGRLAEANQTWVGKDTPAGQIETLKDKVVQFKVGPKFASLSIIEKLKNGKLGDEIVYVISEVKKRRNGEAVADVAVTTASWKRNRGWGNVGYSEFLERVRALDFKAFEGEIINHEGFPMRMRDTVAGAGNSYIMGPDWETRIDVATQAEVVRRLDNEIELSEDHEGVRVSSPINPSAFYQTEGIGDGAIPVNLENLRDFSASTNGENFNVDSLAKRLDDPSRLAKELGKLKMFKKAKPIMYQMADTFGAKSEMEAAFLKSNFKYAEEKGDVFQSEALKRFLAQFDNGTEKATLIRHSLEEWLKVGGEMDTYNSVFQTGRPVVLIGTHGTKSIELIKTGEFRGEMLGGNTGAASAERGHFHSGKQTTSHTYGKVEGKIHEVIDTLNNAFRNLKDTITDPRFSDHESMVKHLKDSFEEAMLLAKDSMSREDRDLHRYWFGETERLLRQVEPELRANEKRIEAVNNIWKGLADEIDAKYPKSIMMDSVNTTGVRYQYPVNSPTSDVSSMMRRLHGQGLSATTEVISRLPTKEMRGEIQSLVEKKFGEKASQQSLKAYEDGLSKTLKPLQEDAQAAYHKAVAGVRKSASNEFEIQQLRSAVGFRNPLVYDFKGSEYREIKYDTLLLKAMKDGHDSVIMLNTFDGGAEVDNIYVTLKGNEGTHIAVLDTNLTGKAKRRGINGEEGGRWLQQTTDDMLPAGSFGPNNPDTVRLRRSIDKKTGKTGDGKFVIKINPAKSFKIGMEYERMKHDPYNPKVRAAYKAFADETLAQMQEIVEAGYIPEMHYKETEPYGSSAEAISDIRDNKKLKVLATDLNFGTRKVTPKDVTENPLLGMSKFKDSNGVPMRINDVFRFVHDFFGHSERGNGFGPLGEENAWDVHARMYSPEAKRAMTAGTRGQNSWVNFVNEPNIEINRKRSMVRNLMKEGRIPEAMEIQKTIGQIRFADQKIGLMPEWTSKLDEQLTPIEKQSYGTHVTSEKTFGLYQGGDDMSHSVWVPEADEFSAAGIQAQASSKFGTSVEIKSGPAYAGYKLFMAGDKRAMGSVSPTGELGSVIKGVNGTAHDVEAVVKAALSTGKVRWLNAFDTVLPSMYDKFGFEAVARIRFVDEYRPDGWDYSKYAKFNAGRPDVVFMAYVGEGKAKAYEKNKERIPLVDSYDDAVALVQAKASEARNKGYMMQETDLSGPDPFKFNKLRGDTVKELAFRDTMFEYAEFVRKTDERIKMGQEPRPRNAVLATYFNKNKDKTFGHSVMTWDKISVWDRSGTGPAKRLIKIEEFTQEHLADIKEQIVRSDPNFKKEFTRWGQENKNTAELKAIDLARQIADEQAAFEREGDALLAKGIYGNETARDRMKRLFKERFNAKAIKYLLSVGGEEVTKIFKTIDKNYDKNTAKLEAARKEKDLRTRKMERIKDQVEVEFLKENEAAENEGLTHEDDAYPHKEFDDEVHLEVLRRLEESEAKETNVEEAFDLKEEDFTDEIEALTKEDAEKLAARRAAGHRRNSAEVYGFADEQGNVKAEDVVKYEPMTPEQLETMMKEENEESFDKEGMRIWDKEEFDAELQKRIRINNSLAEIKKQVEAGTYNPDGSKNQNFGTNLKSGSLQYMAGYKYANSQWFNDKGESILRELTLDGKTMMIEGVIPSVHDSKNSGNNEIVMKYAGMPDKKVKISDVPPEVLAEIRKNAVSVYPEEYTELIKKQEAQLQRLREGAMLNTPVEHLDTLFGLLALYGMEFNRHLLDKNFKAGVNEQSLEGLSGKEVYEEALRQSGRLIVGFDRSAKFTEALQNHPDLFMSTIEILSAIKEGAEYIEKNAKGTIEFEHRVSLAREKGVTIDANMEVKEVLGDNPIIKGWLGEYLRKYPENKELLTTDSSKPLSKEAIEKKVESRFKDYKKAFKEKNKGKLPTEEQRKKFKEETEIKIIREHAIKSGSGEITFVGNFFDQGTGKHHVYGQADSVEYRYYKKLKARNDEIKDRNRYVEKDPVTGKHLVEIERGYKPSQIATGEAWKDFQKEAPFFGPILEREAPRDDSELKRQAKAVAGEIRYDFIENMFDEMNRMILDEADAMQEERGMILKDWKEIAKEKQVERREGQSDKAKARTTAIEAAVNEDAPNISGYDDVDITEPTPELKPKSGVAALLGAIDNATTEAEMHEALGITKPKEKKVEKKKYAPVAEAPVTPKVMPMTSERVTQSISQLVDIGETHPERPNERIITVIENGERKAGAFQVSMQGEGDTATLYIDAIYGFEGKGGGRMAMERILSHADKNEIQVTLEVSPFYAEGGRKLDHARLMKWYESFGFVPWTEASTPTNSYMVRYPKEFKGDMAPAKPSLPYSKEALKRNMAFNHTKMPVSGDMYHEPIGPKPELSQPRAIETSGRESSVADLLDKYQVPVPAKAPAPQAPTTLKLEYNPPPAYDKPIGPERPIQLGYTPEGGNDYDKPIGPRRPAGRPRREKPPVGTPTKAKPVTPTKAEVRQVEATKEKVKNITEAAIKTGTVKPVDAVGASQVVVQQAGPIASVSRENLEHTLAVLSIKDHLTLKMSGGSANPRIATADKRYLVTGKAGKYEVVMQPHQSPYHGQIVDQRRIAVVPTLEHAQLCIREFDTLQRRLAEMQGIDTSAALQATAPVMAPAQIQQVAQQIAQAEAQMPTPPVTSPRTPAEVHPNFNACIVGLSKLRIPRPLAKELVTAAVTALGKDAKIEDIISHCLHANQVMAAQIATANQIHVATVNSTSGAPNPAGVAQVVIMPSNSGLNTAAGSVVPRPPSMGLGYPNFIPSAPVQTATKAMWTPSADQLMVYNVLIRFDQYMSKIKLPNGAEGTGVTLVNAYGYTIQQTGPSRFRVFGPNKALVSVTDNEQQACDEIFRAHFKR